MAAANPLLSRIRGEYLEMPGLRLTLAQASRLWQVDAATCHEALDALLTERFLHRTAEGAYIALPSARAAPAKAGLSPSQAARLNRRRSA
jgi:hypothetical protein